MFLNLSRCRSWRKIFLPASSPLLHRLSFWTKYFCVLQKRSTFYGQRPPKPENLSTPRIKNFVPGTQSSHSVKWKTTVNVVKNKYLLSAFFALGSRLNLSGEFNCQKFKFENKSKNQNSCYCIIVHLAIKSTVFRYCIFGGTNHRLPTKTSQCHITMKFYSGIKIVDNFNICIKNV